jgi:GTP-binding protein
VLGVLDRQERQLIIADIPGLIEGASEGAGLGHEFLAHVERTRLLVHVLDIAPELSAEEGADAAANHEIIERELAAHNQELARLPRVLALSKADLLTPERVRAAVADWQRRLGPDVPVLATSSASGAGLEELAAELLRRVQPRELDAADAEGESPARPGIGAGSGAADGARTNGGGSAAARAARREQGEEQLAEHMVFRPAGGAGFRVERLGPGSFAVRGRGIERLLERYDVENEDAMAYVEGRLRRIGVLKALEVEGFKPGDEIEIGGVTFELDPSSAG